MSNSANSALTVARIANQMKTIANAYKEKNILISHFNEDEFKFTFLARGVPEWKWPDPFDGYIQKPKENA